MNQVANSLIALKNSEQVLPALINTIPNPAFFRNPDGVFVGCNKAFADTMLGTGCENIVGQSACDLAGIIPQALNDICIETDRNLPNISGMQTCETTITCADGVKRDFLLI